MATHPYKDTYLNRIRKHALIMLKNNESVDDVIGFLYAKAFDNKQRDFKDMLITFAADIHVATKSYIQNGTIPSWFNLSNYDSVENIDSNKTTVLC